MKTKLINKLTIVTSAILLLSLLMSAAAWFVSRIAASAPDQQAALRQIQATQDTAELKTSALSLTLSRFEIAHWIFVAMMILLAVQAVTFIFSGISLFWLRRLRHDA